MQEFFSFDSSIDNSKYIIKYPPPKIVSELIHFITLNQLMSN